MTKKDYERAAMVVQTRTDHLGIWRDDAVDLFAAFFRDDNPRFDEARFRAACVPGANVRARGKKVA